MSTSNSQTQSNAGGAHEGAKGNNDGDVSSDGSKGEGREAAAPLNMTVSSDDVNFLVYRYLVESGV